MDLSKYRVRPFRASDYETLSRLVSTVNPEFPMAAEEARHWEESFMAPPLLNEQWIVEERQTGRGVAHAAIQHSPFSFDPQRFYVDAIVDPAHRGVGIGSALLALIDSEAAAHHAVALWTTVRSDDRRSLDFARRHGVVEARRLWVSRLLLAEAQIPPKSERVAALEASGIRFTTLSEEGPEAPLVRQRLHDLQVEASRDVPRVGNYTPVTLEQFVSEAIESPSAMPDAFFLACEGERYIGLSTLERNLAAPDSLRVGFTGTRAAYRGKGVASELKRRAVEYAARHGARSLQTVNDSLNHPMWAINERLGFRREIEWVQGERLFRDVPQEGSEVPTSAPSRAAGR